MELLAQIKDYLRQKGYKNQHYHWQKIPVGASIVVSERKGLGVSLGIRTASGSPEIYTTDLMQAYQIIDTFDMVLSMGIFT